MRLDEHVFEEVAMALGVRHGDEPELNHRRAPRYLVKGAAVIEAHGVAMAVPRSVDLVDISMHGVGFLDRTMISPGSQFLLHLPRAGGHSADVICTAKQCRLTQTGAFRIGGEFTEEVDNPRLLPCMQGMVTARVIAPDATHKRLRIRGSATVVSQGPNPPCYEINVREITLKFFTLTSTHAFAAGDRILLQFKDAGTNHPAAWWCSITRVRLAGTGQYRIQAHNDGPHLLAQPAPARKFLHRWFRRPTETPITASPIGSTFRSASLIV